MRYGMNPHQSAEVISDVGAVRVLAGEPSMINYLDALHAWSAVTEAAEVLHAPVAASYKHVSPAGLAVGGPLDEVMQQTWRVPFDLDPVAAGYVRARDADPKSSFGDVVALSEPVSEAVADVLTTVISDAVIAPGYAPGTVARLAAKKSGRFLVLQGDLGVELPPRERRDVGGLTLEQDRDVAPITADLLAGADLGPETVADALLGMVTLRWTQSNSVAVVRDGRTLGVGAGQQNRVDCVRLALAKARCWWLRRHPYVAGLPHVEGMRRQDRLNWQILLAEDSFAGPQRRTFAALFGDEAAARSLEPDWRTAWSDRLTGLTLVSDGFLPFRDNIDHAAAGGVTTVVEPGGGLRRTTEVQAAAAELGLRHVSTGLRLFRH